LERATQPERAQGSDLFVRLCEIPSPTGDEAAMAAAVRAELESMGLNVEEDDTAAETGAGAGNLLARIPAPPGAPVMLVCAHIDTVPLTAPVEVDRSEGLFRNRNDAILGADNKAAVAVFLQAARRWSERRPPVGVELLFTTSEETGLRGAKAFDRDRLSAAFGYVFDHASPIGGLVVAAPTHYAVAADFLGRAAHAGIRPEQGRNAIVAAAQAIGRMRVGRIDPETTANVGVIAGGTASNVVAERCRLDVEVRSLDDGKAHDLVQEVVDACTWAASATETDVDAHVEQHFRAYRIPDTDPCVEVAAGALRDCGVEPLLHPSGGGSDASVFESRGLRCLNVANGTEANHTSDECVSQRALETMLDVTLRLAERAGATAPTLSAT
jgi:tripeptide aminopeptidase